MVPFTSSAFAAKTKRHKNNSNKTANSDDGFAQKPQACRGHPVVRGSSSSLPSPADTKGHEH
jgi:hypothetical protein